MTTTDTTASPPRWNAELLAGLTIWALVVPSALAYGPIAGVEPTVGLIGVPLALIGYGLLGGSRTLVVGADAAVSVLVGATLAGIDTDQPRAVAMITLSLLVGLIFLALRALRFGWLADIVPTPVLKGFVQGLAITTSVSQVPAMLGFDVGATSNVIDEVVTIIRDLDQLHATSALLGGATLVLLLAGTRYLPSWPVAMMLLVLTGVVVAVAGLADRGVAVVGEPPDLLGGSLSAFHFDADLAAALVPGALAIVIVGFTESLGASQLVRENRGERVDPDRELLGLGAANVAVGIGGSFAVTGALSKTAVAMSAGARTRLANGFAAVLAVLTLVFLRPLFDFVAEPVLAAAVIWAMAGLMDLDYLRQLRHGNRDEFTIALTAMVGVLVFGVMAGVVAATVLSLVLLARHVARPPAGRMHRAASGGWVVDESSHPGDPVDEGIAVIRFDGPLVFVNARVAAERLLALGERPDVQLVVLDASAITGIDSTAVAALSSVVRQVEEHGDTFWVVGVIERVEERLVRLTDLDVTRFGLFETVDDAIEAWDERTAASRGDP